MHYKDAISIFGKSKASDHEIARAIGSLAILQNLATLRSIYLKGIEHIIWITIMQEQVQATVLTSIGHGWNK